MSDALATLEIPLDRRPYLNLSSLLFRRAGGPADAADEQVAVFRTGVSLLVVTELDVEDPGAAVLARPGDRFVVFGVVLGWPGGCQRAVLAQRGVPERGWRRLLGANPGSRADLLCGILPGG